MKKLKIIGLLFLIVTTCTLCRKAQPFPEAQYDPRLSGGAATSFIFSSKAFGEPVDGLSAYDAFIHDLGDAAFEQTFVTAPAPIFGGLGPVYNNVSCVSCHHNDGKGTATIGQVNSSLLTRISLPGADAYGGPQPVMGFGGQLQDKAVAGKTPEAKININYIDKIFTFPDGETFTLHEPVYTVNSPYQTWPGATQMSVRLAPPVFGLGLLELVPEAGILQMVDEADFDQDGISGRANYVYDPVSQKTVLGRFGLKANTPSLLVQIAGAFHQDMGITNYVFREESSKGQIQYDGLQDDPELADTLLDAVTFYIRTLAVPARRDVEHPKVKRGEQLFRQINCSACHVPTLHTGVDLRLPVLSNQRIHPYTDLLLHDMGEGLADNRPDFLANGREWRTPALWGIGLFEKTNGVPYYLHDGRARTLQEAILWHGGEAKHSKEQFVNLSKGDREALIAFLKSL